MFNMIISPVKYLNNYNFSYNSYKKSVTAFGAKSLTQDGFEKQIQTSSQSKIETGSKEFQEKFVAMVEPYKDLTLESDINLFSDIKVNHIYTVPLKFGIMVSNSLQRTNDAHIYQSTPKVFENNDRDKIYDALDEFARKNNKKNKQSITVGSQEFQVEYLSGGSCGDAYLIKDENETGAVIKIYKDKHKLMEPRGFLAEIPTMAELSKRKTKNTPEFYMANAGFYKYEKGEIKKDTPWMLEEYISWETPMKNSEKTLGDFFRETNLTHFDWFENKIGDYFIDMGGVLPDNYYDFIDNLKGEERDKVKDFQKTFLQILENLRTGMSIEDILNRAGCILSAG